MWKKLDSSKILFVLINIAVASLMFYMTRQTPLYSDDLAHRLNEDGSKVMTYRDVFHKANLTYFNWGGRYLADLLINYFVSLGRGLYEVLNALIYVLFACEMHAYVYRNQVSCFYLTVIYCFLWLFTPSFGGLYLWMTGSVTYLWFMVPVLLHGLIYYRWMEGVSDPRRVKGEGSFIKSICFSIGMFALGVVAGWSIEAASSILLASITVSLFFAWKRKLKNGIPYIFGWVGVLCGWGLLMFAPGNFVRAGFVSESGNLLIKYLFRIGRETYYMILFLAIPLGVAIGFIVFGYVQFSTRMDSRGESSKILWLENCKRNPAPFLFLLLALLSVYIMTFSAAFSNRIFIMPLALLLITIGFLLRDNLNSDGENGMERNAARVAATAMLFFLVLYCSVQILTALMTCSARKVPIEKYVDYHYGDFEKGIIN